MTLVQCFLHRIEDWGMELYGNIDNVFDEVRVPAVRPAGQRRRSVDRWWCSTIGRRYTVGLRKTW
ncbi:MAG: hypothetical protein R3C04_00485 [Hyphomonas sp.]